MQANCYLGGALASGSSFCVCVTSRCGVCGAPDRCVLQCRRDVQRGASPSTPVLVRGASLRGGTRVERERAVGRLSRLSLQCPRHTAAPPARAPPPGLIPRPPPDLSTLCTAWSTQPRLDPFIYTPNWLHDTTAPSHAGASTKSCSTPVLWDSMQLIPPRPLLTSS